MGAENSGDGRSRILEAATRVFALKSFEGSRIEEIAREAGVPKSLIYYHFKSKDEILEVLTQRFIDEYTAILSVAENETHREKADKLAVRMKNLYMEFEKRNADLIRVMLIDSLKKTKERPIVFKVVEAMIDAEKKHASEGFNTQERLMAEFFTRLIPNYAYICFKDAWVSYFDTTREETEAQFLKLIVDTHGSYHRYHE
ncbi:MAG: TetR/AcrR family transcriptional regulator [Clostridia bacterium]|nr:TetR/AcrR family transcriptional regulator [Clostridia bacterium]